MDKVIIDAKSLGRRWVFPCGHWLSDKDEDRLLERELYPQELATEEYAPRKFSHTNVLIMHCTNGIICHVKYSAE